jgi:hypothetical protein
VSMGLSIVNKDFAGDFAYEILRFFFDHKPDLDATHVQFNAILLENANKGGTNVRTTGNVSEILSCGRWICFDQTRNLYRPFRHGRTGRYLPSPIPQNKKI